MPDRLQAERPVVRVGIGIVFEPSPEGWLVLITRRLSDAVLGGLWELPGGNMLDAETPAQCVVRELLEEVALVVEPLRALSTVEHLYDHARVELHPWVCARRGGQAENRQVAEHRWVRPDELPSYALPPANKPLLTEIDRLFRSGDPLGHQCSTVAPRE